MTNNDEHIHPRLLQEYVDGTLSLGEKHAVLTHLERCGACRSAVSGLTRLDDALKHLPHERAGEWMTRTVMSRLEIGRGSDVAYRIISHAGGLVALLFVAGILVAVFSLMGVIDTQAVSSGDNFTGPWSGAITNFISRAVGATGSLAGRVMPTVANSSGALIWVFGATVLGILGGIDLLLQRKSERR